MKTIVTLMAIILNVTLITLDWSLGLFVAAIILGKYIWIDFIFDRISLISQIEAIKKIVKSNGDISVEFLCFNYAKFFYPSFLMTFAIYQFLFSGIPSTSIKLILMIDMYVVLISMIVSSFSGMDRVV